MSAFCDTHAVLTERFLTCPDDVLRVLAERLYIHHNTASSRPIHERGRIVSGTWQYSLKNVTLTATVYTGVNEDRKANTQAGSPHMNSVRSTKVIG